MLDITAASAQSEPEFAALVDAIAADPDRRAQLIELLREDHPFYRQRASTAIVRMRGWVLFALAHTGVPDAALIFVLEELETGVDAYLVAAAARALRACHHPTDTLAPFVMRALTNIRYRDEPVSFESYGEYATSSTGTSPVRELLATLTWLGPLARGIVPELESLRAQVRGKLRIDIDRALQAIRSADRAAEAGPHPCCGSSNEPASTNSWAPDARRDCGPVESIVFEDHDGQPITFGQFFRGQPSIVAFFYTRCDNPMKCSLTVAKLARVQKLLEAHGLTDQMRTAAITYDPAFDIPERLRIYGQDRGVRLDANHRMLRAVDRNDVLDGYFELGVNFIESLVNRHRIEAYILDAKGRIAVSFERIHWDEQQIVRRAIEVLYEKES
jgi:cytochrome oxidase Cu insertion factor (SCO1/SenC/PrrC family)